MPETYITETKVVNFSDQEILTLLSLGNYRIEQVKRPDTSGSAYTQFTLERDMKP